MGPRVGVPVGVVVGVDLLLSVRDLLAEDLGVILPPSSVAAVVAAVGVLATGVDGPFLFFPASISIPPFTDSLLAGKPCVCFSLDTSFDETVDVPRDSVAVLASLGVCGDCRLGAL